MRTPAKYFSQSVNPDDKTLREQARLKKALDEPVTLLEPSHPPASGSAGIVAALGGGAAFLAKQGVDLGPPPAPAEAPNPVANFAMGVVGAVSEFVSGLRGVFAGDPRFHSLQEEEKRNEYDGNDSANSGSSKARDGYNEYSPQLLTKRRLEAAALERKVDKTLEEQTRLDRVWSWLRAIDGDRENPNDNADYFVVPDSVEICNREVDERNWNNHGPLGTGPNGRGFANHLGDRTRQPFRHLRPVIDRWGMSPGGNPADSPQTRRLGETPFSTGDSNDCLMTFVLPGGIGESPSFQFVCTNSRQDWDIVDVNGVPVWQLSSAFTGYIPDAEWIDDLGRGDQSWIWYFQDIYPAGSNVSMQFVDGDLHVQIESNDETGKITVEMCERLSDEFDNDALSLSIPGVSGEAAGCIWIRHSTACPVEPDLSSNHSRHEDDAIMPKEEMVYGNPDVPADEQSYVSGSEERHEGVSSGSGDWTGDSDDGDASQDARAQEQMDESSEDVGPAAGRASNSSVPLRTCLVPYCEDQYVCWVTHDCYPGHGWKGVCAKCFPKLQTKRRGEDEVRKCPGCNLFQGWDYVLPPR